MSHHQPQQDELRNALEALVADERSFRELTKHLGGFNVFEALGQVRREIRHSDFLAYILDPSETHPLGDDVLRIWLGYLLPEVSAPEARRVLLHALADDLNHVLVTRELLNTDILAVDHSNRFALIVENKIDSSEHTDQLNRYWTSIEARYPDFTLIGVYLTPFGDPPSDERFLAVSYESVANLLTEIREGSGDHIDAHFMRTVEDYELVIRRQIIMSDEYLEDLARKLYQRHKPALDFIFERRPDLTSHIRDAALEHLGTRSDIILINQGKTQVEFCPARWANNPNLLAARDGKGDQPALRFQIVIDTKTGRTKLALRIVFASHDQRDALYEIAKTGGDDRFRNRTIPPGKDSTTIMYTYLVSPSDLEKVEEEELPDLAVENLEQFLTSDLSWYVKRFEDFGVHGSQQP